MAETRRIQKLEQTEPVHAICDMPKFSFKRIIGIELGRAQSSHMDEIHLAVDIDFGAISLRIAEADYTLSLASALVILEKSNADIKLHSKYSEVLNMGEIDAKLLEKKSYSKSSSLALESKANTKSGFSLGGLVSGKRDRNQSAEDTTHVTHQINLVSPEGQDSWRIGGPEGNPLLLTKDLRGPVINSRPDDAMKPLCTLVAINADEPVSGRLRIQAHPADFRLRGESRTTHVSEETADGIARDQDKFAKRETAQERELRERVATMALLNLPKRDCPDEGMLDLASRTFTFVPEIETPAHG